MEDHISKALERAQEQQQSKGSKHEQKPSVRNWVKPTSKVGKSSPPAATPTDIDIDISHLASGGILSNTEIDDALIVDRYRLLRTRLHQRMKPRGWNKIGVTSPASKEGKSFNCINLAVTFARETNSRVVLIDADVRRPSVANYLGIDVTVGLFDYLEGNAEINDIVKAPTNLGNLLVIPGTVASAGTSMSNSLGSERMAELIATFDDEETTIVTDLPPVLVADDVLSIAPLIDALIIVIRDGQTNLNELQETTELLSDVNLLGTVLNAVEENSRGIYGYYYNSESSA